MTNVFDNANRVLSRGATDGGAEQFGYSASGLIAYTNQLGKVTRYVYDAARRKTFETNAFPATLQFKYDPANHLKGS